MSICTARIAIITTCTMQCTSTVHTIVGMVSQILLCTYYQQPLNSPLFVDTQSKSVKILRTQIGWRRQTPC